MPRACGGPATAIYGKAIGEAFLDPLSREGGGRDVRTSGTAGSRNSRDISGLFLYNHFSSLLSPALPRVLAGLTPSRSRWPPPGCPGTQTGQHLTPTHCHHGSPSPVHDSSPLSAWPLMGLLGHSLTPAGEVGHHDPQGQLPKGKGPGKPNQTIPPQPKARSTSPAEKGGPARGVLCVSQIVQWPDATARPAPDTARAGSVSHTAPGCGKLSVHPIA